MEFGHLGFRNCQLGSGDYSIFLEMEETDASIQKGKEYLNGKFPEMKIISPWVGLRKPIVFPGLFPETDRFSSSV